MNVQNHRSVHVCLMIFPNQEDLLMFDPTSLTVINVLKLKCYAQKVIHRNYTEPNICHHKMGPMHGDTGVYMKIC